MENLFPVVLSIKNINAIIINNLRGILPPIAQGDEKGNK